ncbi:MAG: hypothetical protein ACUZ8E_14580 [Candidatus Anammoxibacter sp.]
MNEDYNVTVANGERKAIRSVERKPSKPNSSYNPLLQLIVYTNLEATCP